MPYSSKMPASNVSSCPPGGAMSGMEPTVDTVAVQPIPAYLYYVLAGGGALLLMVTVSVVVVLCCHRYHWATKKTSHHHSVLYHSNQQLSQHGHRNYYQDPNPSYNLVHSNNHLYPGTGPGLHRLTIRLEKDQSCDNQCWNQVLGLLKNALFEVVDTRTADFSKTSAVRWRELYVRHSCCCWRLIPLTDQDASLLNFLGFTWWTEIRTFFWQENKKRTSDEGIKTLFFRESLQPKLKVKRTKKYITRWIPSWMRTWKYTRSVQCQSCNSMFSSVRMSVLLWFAAWSLPASKYPVQHRRDLHTGTARYGPQCVRHKGTRLFLWVSSTCLWERVTETD